MIHRNRCLAMLAAALTWIGGTSVASGNAVESEIRRLDHAEAEALFHKDIVALEKLWAADLTVNNPRNTISRGRDAVLALIRNGSIDYSAFEREIEEMQFHGDTVIVMGQETVTAVGAAPHAGQTIKRRYTNFWMKRDGEWRLTARHANVICTD